MRPQFSTRISSTAPGSETPTAIEVCRNRRSRWPHTLPSRRIVAKSCSPSISRSEFEGWDLDELRCRRHRTKRFSGTRGDRFSKQEVFWRRPARLVERREIVVTRGYRRVCRVIGSVGAVVESKVRSPAEHVNIDRAVVAQHPIEIARLLCVIAARVLFAPVIEPAVPVLAANERLVRSQLHRGGELPFRFAGAERRSDPNIRKRAASEIARLVDRVIRRLTKSGRIESAA